MATPFANHQRNDEVTRRGTLISALVTLVCAPTIMPAASLMRVRGSVAQPRRPQEGFVRRLLFASCDNALRGAHRQRVLC